MIYKMAGKTDPFARVPNDLLNDVRLSWKAKGIAAYLCGKPTGWKMRVTDLVKRGIDGKHSIRAALDELRAAGYAEYVQSREKGAFGEGEWKISDTPIYSPLPEKRDAGKRDSENQHHSKKELSKMEFSKIQSKETKESKETAPAETASKNSFDAVWKPISGTKAEQLRRIEPPFDFPDEREFDEFIAEDCLDHIGMGKRGDLYRDLCVAKWHQWTGRKWRPIRDWRKYVKALDVKMEEATTGRGF